MRKMDAQQQKVLDDIQSEMDDVKKAASGELAALRMEIERKKLELEKMQAARMEELNRRLQEAEQMKEQMKDRCPGAEFVGTGSIENYELQFKGSLHGAHATIAPKEGSSVPVGMWTIQKRDESRLDMYEGYNPKGYCYYNKEQIPVKMDDGSSLTGMVYIMDQRMDFGNPSKSYYDIVRQGYADCGLDTNVLDHAVNDSMDLAQQRMECEGMRFF